MSDKGFYNVLNMTAEKFKNFKRKKYKINV
jgi:hypothetical protein